MCIRDSSYAGRQAAQPDDTYIVVDTGSNRHSDYYRLKLYCCSNATSSNVGYFTFPNGRARSSNYDDFTITRYSSSDSYAGCIYMEIYYRRESCRNTYSSYYRTYRRVCETDVNFSLESSQTGIYTCTVPDRSGNNQRVNFALYSEGSKY